MSQRALFIAILAAFLSSGCAGVHLTGPMPSDIGGEEVVKPLPQKFRGQPMVQLTFVSSIDPAAESEFLKDYTIFPVTALGYGSTVSETADPSTARINMNGMMAKNTFYAFHLAKYLKMKADGDYAVILNPVTLKYDFLKGYYYEPFEEQMPPYDIEIGFLSYVDPRSQPSNKGDVITTHGESLAPIVSVRMDPSFNSIVDGAIAMSSPMIRHAHNPDSLGVRAQFIDYLNVLKNGTAPMDLSKYAVSSGDFKVGSFYELDFGTYDLSEEPSPEEVVPAEIRDAWDYDSGSYYADEFYQGYYKIIMSALQKIDNTALATESQKNYWSYYENDDLTPVMLNATDRKKRRFLIKAKQVELQYLQDRDDNWMAGVLETNDFNSAFNKLRDAEQEARNDYVNAQIKAVGGALLAILGAAAAVTSDNSAASMGGAAAMGLGVGFVVDAMAEFDEVDNAFETAFESAYESQKSYVFEMAEGEKVTVRARDYTDFKRQLKARYHERFRPSAVPVS